MNLLLSLRHRVHGTTGMIVMDATAEDLEIYRRAPSETPDAVLTIPRARLHMTAGNHGARQRSGRRHSRREGDLIWLHR